MSGPTKEDHWGLVYRGTDLVLHLDKAAEDMAWLIASNTAPPYELAGPSHATEPMVRRTTYRDSRLEDGCGNELALDQVAKVLNHVPALLVEVRTLRKALALAQGRAE